MMTEPLQTTSDSSTMPTAGPAPFVEKTPLEHYLPPAKPSLVGLSRAQLAEALATVGVPPAQASALVHTAEIFTTGASAASHIYHRNVDWRYVMRLGIPGVLGAILGAWILSNIELVAARCQQRVLADRQIWWLRLYASPAFLHAKSQVFFPESGGPRSGLLQLLFDLSSLNDLQSVGVVDSTLADTRHCIP